MKDSAALFSQGLVNDDASACNTPAKPQDGKTKFNYTCTFQQGTEATYDNSTDPPTLVTPATGNALVITATGNPAPIGSSAIDGKELVSCLSFDSGAIKQDNILDESQPVVAADCTTL